MTKPSEPASPSRRRALKVLGTVAAAASSAACGSDAFDSFFQDHYQRMTPAEVKRAVERLQRRYKERLDADVEVKTTPAEKGVLFGYALNISKCKGYRDCVDACQKENNLGTDPEMAYIRVLEMDQGSLDLLHADHYYDHETVPQEKKVYMPISCMQCDDPPCVSACPVNATWQEDDGITVVDYDWCIGCRACSVACPYWARHFNWKTPEIPAADLNKDTHYLSNRPRDKGVIEKCTFCLHRVREGRLPACQEACPTGARVFGNLLDPKSDLRYILEHKTVFRLKEDLKTEPKFWYYTD